ncbi:MAG: 4'-phosphopantetheinyl transferase superfamily protein [Chthoniobacterales bacterium]
MRACLNESPPSPVREVRIWTAHLDALQASDIAHLQPSLDETERARAARFHFEKDRRHFIAARGLLRELVGAMLETSPEFLQFVYGPHGKPAVASPAKDGRFLRFNLSHSAGWAMFACTWDREVGIDLESTARLAADDAHLSALAARILSTREFEVWRGLADSAARHIAFLRAWTRKESYVKAKGQGVFDDLRAVEVIQDAAMPAASLHVAGAWIIHDLPAPHGFAAALTVAAI